MSLLNYMMEIMEPINPFNSSVEQKITVLGMVNLIKKKRDHTEDHPNLKGQSCVKCKPQQPLYAKEETASPIVSCFYLTLIIDAKEKCDVVCADVVKAYLRAKMDELVIMQITGAEVEIRCNLNLTRAKFVETDKKGKKTLFVQLRKALYECVRSALLWMTTNSAMLMPLWLHI